MKGGPANVIEQALVVDPWSADLTFGLGLTYLRQGDARANQMANRFLQVAPNSVIAKRVKQ